jgi:hypothetical protein
MRFLDRFNIFLELPLIFEDEFIESAQNYPQPDGGKDFGHMVDFERTTE